MKKSVCLFRSPSIPSEYHGKYIGNKDIPLSEKGISELELVKERIPEKFYKGKIYHAPNSQCKESFNHLGFSATHPREVREELREINFGEWDGHSFSQLIETFPEDLKRFAEFSPKFHFPNGESISEFQTRIESFKISIHSSSDRSILIIGPGSSLSLLLCSFLNIPYINYTRFRLSPSSLVFMDLYENGTAVLTELIRNSSSRRCEWPG
ncbi:histidine phosphatase family protein [Leptospira sarikeiensis]|uniref:Histidine phosphatase family protein n=1 Tax=Leptospira sarikeiensis TaxID=2484943 RepID=A0A4R9JYS5_9LEPT|nr:histidine phosphatase family protein [Leptospira sarikeiensis]TGL58427.1 histidine phosphatase family protein [Leptospira sarikeiensis]